jgi:hypothetical protein
MTPRNTASTSKAPQRTRASTPGQHASRDSRAPQALAQKAARAVLVRCFTLHLRKASMVRVPAGVTANQRRRREPMQEDG